MRLAAFLAFLCRHCFAVCDVMRMQLRQALCWPSMASCSSLLAFIPTLQ